jgi:phage tail sheath protein FI
VAAGIVARRELAHGITWGPGNELAVGIVDGADRVNGRRHDDLHQNAINVLLRDRDGVRLTAARTLSSDISYRQLSVRRLVTMMERTLARELDWTTFEPHSAALRADVRSQLDRFLRTLYRQGAFRGATEDEAFLVRCDEELNPRQTIEAGRLIAEIRIAPAEPIEFLVLRIVRGGDGTLTLESRNG